MNILITGGAGYLGANLCASLLQEETVESMLVYDNFSRKNFNSLAMCHDSHAGKLSIRYADILDNAELSKAIESCEFIVHLAAVSRTPFNDDNPHYFDQINHWGTASLVREIEKSADKKRIIFVSSGSVYGRTEVAGDENKVPHPVTSYALSKFAAENQIQRLDEKHDVAILRFGNIFGLGKATRFDSVINKFFLDAVLSRPLRIEGSGHQVRPFIYIDEAVEMLKIFIQHRHLKGFYNVNSHNWSVNEIVEGFRLQFKDLEAININQNEKLRDLMFEPSSIVKESLVENMERDFSSYLKDMFSRFNDAQADL